jgi:hypothetical protein
LHPHIDCASNQHSHGIAHPVTISSIPHLKREALIGCREVFGIDGTKMLICQWHVLKVVSETLMQKVKGRTAHADRNDRRVSGAATSQCCKGFAFTVGGSGLQGLVNVAAVSTDWDNANILCFAATTRTVFNGSAVSCGYLRFG